MEKLSFVEYDMDFLDRSWEWLNDPEIRMLTQTPPFTREQQLAWFMNLPQRTDYLVWGMRMDNTPVGVVGLKNITNDEGEYFGYIGTRELWNKGLSRLMLDFIKEEAQRRGLKQLYLKVSPSNIRAIKAYEKNGFVMTGEDINEVLMKYYFENV